MRWARDAHEANRIVSELVRATGAEPLLGLLTERLQDYKVTVRRCAPADVRAMLAELTRGLRVAVPEGFELGVADAVPDKALNRIRSSRAFPNCCGGWNRGTR